MVKFILGIILRGNISLFLCACIISVKKADEHINNEEISKDFYES